jgi:hypothetical protein
MPKKTKAFPPRRRQARLATARESQPATAAANTEPQTERVT